MSFQNFIEQVPKAEYMEAKVYKGDNIILFKPKNFLVGVKVYFDDFHFSIPTMAPPPMHIGKKEYQFKKEKLLVFSPSMDSFMKNDAPSREYSAFSVNKEYLRDIAYQVTGKKFTSAEKPEYSFSPQLISTLRSFQYEIDTYHSQCPLMLESVSLQLAIQLIREINHNFNENKAVPDNNYIKRSIEYMEAYYNASISIEDICKAVYLSPYHFIRMFKEKTGMSPHEYLLSIRLRKAKELLEKGECNISELAVLCGFINQSHFSTVFKNYTGMPPSVYKKHFFMKNSEHMN